MKVINQLKAGIKAAITTLTRRDSSSADEKEQQATAIVAGLEGEVSALKGATLLQAADCIANATAALERAVAAASRGRSMVISRPSRDIWSGSIASRERRMRAMAWKAPSGRSIRTFRSLRYALRISRATWPTTSSTASWSVSHMLYLLGGYNGLGYRSEPCRHRTSGAFPTYTNRASS
jgi:hypothetical protein